MLDLKETVFRSPTVKNKGCLLDNKTSSMTRILRMLSGTCSMAKITAKAHKKLKTNYFICPPQDSKHSIKELNKSLPEGIDVKYYSHISSRSKTNEKFYSKIDHELRHCIYYHSLDRHLESFTMLYRIIEGLSYAFPLIYTSRSKSYTDSYTSLQTYLGNSGSGELNFLKKFIETSLTNTDFVNLEFDIVFDSENDDQNQRNYKHYRRQIADDCIIGETEDVELNLSYIGIYQAIITLRNRYFHFKQGSGIKNIATKDISDPNAFFKPIISPALNWFALLFMEIISHDLENHDNSAS